MFPIFNVILTRNCFGGVDELPMKRARKRG
jgi:hypothetical protein